MLSLPRWLLQDYLRTVAKVRREFSDVLADDGKGVADVWASGYVATEKPAAVATPKPASPAGPLQAFLLLPPRPRPADNNIGRNSGQTTPGGTPPPPPGSEKQPPKYEPQLSLTPFCNTKVIHFIRHGCGRASRGLRTSSRGVCLRYGVGERQARVACLLWEQATGLLPASRCWRGKGHGIPSAASGGVTSARLCPAPLPLRTSRALGPAASHPNRRHLPTTAPAARASTTSATARTWTRG